MGSLPSETLGDTNKLGNKKKRWSVQDDGKHSGKAANLDFKDEQRQPAW